MNTDLAPAVDTGHRAAIGSRSYGDDPALVGRMDAAAVKGFARADLVSAAKHFPNHRPALEDSHVERLRTDYDMQTVVQWDLPRFRVAVKAGAPVVMVGHLVYPDNPDRPVSLSPNAMRFLRRELGLDGVLATDDLAMEGARLGGTTAARAALAAVTVGVDLLMISGPSKEAGRCLRHRRNGSRIREDPARADRRLRRAHQEHQGPIPLYGGNR